MDHKLLISCLLNPVKKKICHVSDARFVNFYTYDAHVIPQIMVAFERTAFYTKPLLLNFSFVLNKAIQNERNEIELFG